jgi:hypothetical protein
MAQGNGKLGKAGSRQKSVGSQRRKTGRVAKKQSKGSSKIESKNKFIVAATKQINQKNERLIAAKATNGHTKFYLKDLTEKGAWRNNGSLIFFVFCRSCHDVCFAVILSSGRLYDHIVFSFCAFPLFIPIKHNDRQE